MSQYTFIDLFSGCGGMSLGFEQAGFKCLLAIDCWEDALATYRYNWKDANTLCEDIDKINVSKLARNLRISKVDLIIGEPPCQGFSIAGNPIVDDDRNALYKSFVRFVATFHPKAFVMENMPNVLTMEGGTIKILMRINKLATQYHQY